MKNLRKVVMENKKIRAGVLCLISAIFLGGCGTKPYQLTEAEESVIINYAAHVVSKYNGIQQSGLTYVKLSEDEPEEASEIADDLTAAEEPEKNEPAESLGTTGEGIQEAVVTSAELDDIFGTEGLHISYEGSEVQKSYIEDAVYAVQAAEGKTCLVLNFHITNTGSGEIAINNLSLNPTFHLFYTDESGNEKSAVSMNTFLLNDFSTYEASIGAQESREAVLLFEVPESVSSFGHLKLIIGINGNNYNINL